MLHAVRTDEAIAAYLERMQRIWRPHVDAGHETARRHAAPRPPASPRPSSPARSTPVTSRRRTSTELSEHPRGDALRAADPARCRSRARRTPRRSRADKRVDVLIGEAIERHQDAARRVRRHRLAHARRGADEHGVPVEKLRGDVRHLIFAGQGGLLRAVDPADDGARPAPRPAGAGARGGAGRLARGPGHDGADRRGWTTSASCRRRSAATSR